MLNAISFCFSASVIAVFLLFRNCVGDIFPFMPFNSWVQPPSQLTTASLSGSDRVHLVHPGVPAPRVPRSRSARRHPAASSRARQRNRGRPWHRQSCQSWGSPSGPRPHPGGPWGSPPEGRDWSGGSVCGVWAGARWRCLTMTPEEMHSPGLIE